MSTSKHLLELLTNDDLSFAIEWLEVYDGEESQDNADSRDRVVAWMCSVLQARQDDETVRNIALTYDLSVAEARKVLKMARGGS